MIALYEVLEQKRMLDQKIEELKIILQTNQDENLAEELVALLELRQSKLINIHAANVKSTITLGASTVDIATAIIIRDTVMDKIKYITNLIKDPESNLDKLKLMEQRDKAFSEYVLLEMAIAKNDLNVNLG